MIPTFIRHVMCAIPCCWHLWRCRRHGIVHHHFDIQHCRSSCPYKIQTDKIQASALHELSITQIWNMAWNKFKKFGKKYWEENRRQRNRVVSIRKQSMKNYFEKKCEKPDINFWATISPFLSDKKFKGNNTITIKEDNETITDQNKVAEIFNKYFVSIAAEIVFPDPITSSDEALLTHQNHPSAIKNQEKTPWITQLFLVSCHKPTKNHDLHETIQYKKGNWLRQYPR